MSSPNLAARYKTSRIGRGFSLLEFAIVLAVFAMVLGTFLVPLTKQIEQQRYTETQRMLTVAREALVAFAAANGRLPCPASPVSNGVEDFSVAPVGTRANGLCVGYIPGAVVFSGFLPAATLGFTPVDDQGYAIDAWGLQQNRIRYAVTADTYLVASDLVTPNHATFTSATGVKDNPLDVLSDNMPGRPFLYICADKPNPAGGASCGLAPPAGPFRLANGNAVAVIYSLGANAADNAPSPTEKLNWDPANPNKVDPVFVSHGLRTTGEVFDDVVTWIGPNLLIGRMIAAGKLP
jgi:prepilin-type N-terminal cleavage/methylation domain-containing protein